MKQFYALTILFFLVVNFSEAQSNYKPGYMVSLKGDTAKGFINYREWDNNPDKFDFKPNSANNKLQEFSVSNALAFGVTGLDQYERFLAKISTDKNIGTDLSVGIDTSTVTKNLFLQILARGKYLALYSYKDKIRTRFFIFNVKERQLSELSYHIYYNRDDQHEVTFNRRYRNQLFALAQEYNPDNHELKSHIESSGYSPDELTKIVNRINTDYETVSSKNFGLTFYAGAGFSSNNISTGFYGNYNYLNPYTVNNKISPVFTAGLNIYLNKLTQRLYLRGELSYLSDSHNYNSYYQAQDISTAISLKYSYVAISPQVAYTFYSTDDLKIFADAGFIIKSISKKVTFHDTYNSVKQNHDMELLEPDSPPHINYIFKAGLVFHTVEFYTNYIPASQVFNYPGFAVKVSYFQAGVNYRFGL